MLKEQLESMLNEIEKLNDLYRNTYSNYKQAQRFYKNTYFLSEAVKKDAFVDYAKYLEAICVLDSAMAILGLPTKQIEKEVDYEVDYEQD